ncbi:Uncharacterized protein PKNOH_S120148400 [Plasmodium knowlesi]|uniref:Kelch domain-containing protein n=1 Tax=Plasmodium knowlesi TaxID=5850 RepID=A0A1Y3DNK4_PLAKN|nr:Uncharacterized protein PKNOH_S120148400 [Plasmodium knowlesi]
MSSSGISNECNKNGQTNFSLNVLHSKCSPPSGKRDEEDNCNFEDGEKTHAVDTLRNNITQGGVLKAEIITQNGENNLSNHKNEPIHPQHLQENIFINMKEEHAKQNVNLNKGYPYKWNKEQNDPCAEKGMEEKSGDVFFKMANEYNSNQSKTIAGNVDVSPSKADRSNFTFEKNCLNRSECRSSLLNGVEESHPDEVKKSISVEKICPLSANKDRGKIMPTGRGENDVSVGTCNKREHPQGGRQMNRQETPIPFFTSPIPKAVWKSDKFTGHLNGHSSIVTHTQNDTQSPSYMAKGKNCALKKKHENILLSDREEVIYVNNRNGGNLCGKNKRGGGFHDEDEKMACTNERISEDSSERSITDQDADDEINNEPRYVSYVDLRAVESGNLNLLPPNGWNDQINKHARGENSPPTNCPEVYTNGNLTHSERGYSFNNHKTHQNFMNNVKIHVHHKAIDYDMKEEQTFNASKGNQEKDLTEKESLPIHVNPFNASKHVTKDAPEMEGTPVKENGFLPRDDVEKTTKKEMTRKDNTAECLSSVHRNWRTYEGTLTVPEEEEIVNAEERKKHGMKKDPRGCITNFSYAQSGHRENGCISNRSFVEENYDGMNLTNGAKQNGCVPVMEGMDKFDDGKETHIGGGMNLSRYPLKGNEDHLHASRKGTTFNEMNGIFQGGEDSTMCHSISEGASDTNGKSTQKSCPPSSRQKVPSLQTKREQYPNDEPNTEKAPAEDKSIFNYHAEWMNGLEEGKDKMTNGEFYNIRSVHKETTRTNNSGSLDQNLQNSHPVFHPLKKNIYPSAVIPKVGAEWKFPYMRKDGNSHTNIDRRGPKEIMRNNGDITEENKKQILGYTPMVHPFREEQTNEQNYPHDNMSSIAESLSSKQVSTKWKGKNTRETDSTCNQIEAKELINGENKIIAQDNSPLFANGYSPHTDITIDPKEEYTLGNVSKWEEANRNEGGKLSKWIYSSNNLSGGVNFGHVYSMHRNKESLKRGKEEFLNHKMDNQLANGVHPNDDENSFPMRSYSYGVPTRRSEISDLAPLSGVFFGMTPSICREGINQMNTGNLINGGGGYLKGGPSEGSSENVEKMGEASYNQEGRNCQMVKRKDSPNVLGENNPTHGVSSVGNNEQGRDIRNGADVKYLYSSGERGDGIQKSEIKDGRNFGNDMDGKYGDLADATDEEMYKLMEDLPFGRDKKEIAEEHEDRSKNTCVNLEDETIIHAYADRHDCGALHGEEELLSEMIEQQGWTTFDPNNDYRWKLCHVRYPEHINFKKAFFFTFQNEIYIYGARKNNFIIPNVLFRIRDGEVESVHTRGTAPKLYVKVYFAVEEGNISRSIDEECKSFYIWGANEKRQLDLYTVYRLDLCRLQWEEIRITYNRNLNMCREDFSLILIKKCLYMYGGVVLKNGEWICCDELWVCDTGRRKWEMIFVGGRGNHDEDTTQKEGIFFSSLPATNVLKLFTNSGRTSSKGTALEGGKRSESEKGKDAQGEGSLSKSTVTRCEEKQPSRRAGHLCVVYKNRMYIHGGTNLAEEKSDFYFFDFAKNKWFEVMPSGEVVPPKRYGHSGVVVKNKLYMYGGFTKNPNGNSINNDIFEYDFVKNKWRQVFSIGDLIYLKSCLNGKEQSYLKFMKLLVMRRYYRSATISASPDVGEVERALYDISPRGCIQKGREERLPNGKAKNATKSTFHPEDTHTKVHANFVHMEETPHSNEAIIPQNIFRNKSLYFNGCLYLFGGCGLDNHFERREENKLFLHYDSVFKMKIGHSYVRCFAHYLSHGDTFFWDLMAKEEMALHEWVQRERNVKKDTTTHPVQTVKNDFDHLWSQLNEDNETSITSGDARQKDASSVIKKIDYMLREISSPFLSGELGEGSDLEGGDLREDTLIEAKVVPSTLEDGIMTNSPDKSSETNNLGDSFLLCQGKKMFQLLTWLIDLYHSDVCADEMATDMTPGQCHVSNLWLEEGSPMEHESHTDSPDLFPEGKADRISTFDVHSEVESLSRGKGQGDPFPTTDQKEARNGHSEDTQGGEAPPTTDGAKEEDLSGECFQGRNLPSNQFGKKNKSKCSASVQEVSQVHSVQDCPPGEIPTTTLDASCNNHHNNGGENEGRRKVQLNNNYLKGHKEGVGFAPPEGKNNPNDHHVCDRNYLRFSKGGKMENHFEKQKEHISLGEEKSEGASEFSRNLCGNTYLIPDYANSNHIYLNMEKSIIYNYLQEFNDLTDDSYSIKMKIRRNEIYKLIYTYTKSVEIQNSVCFKMLEQLEGQARQLLAEKDHHTDGGIQVENAENDESSFDSADEEQSNKKHHLPFSEDNFVSLQNEHGHLKKKMKYFCDMANIYSIKINKLILYIRILEKKYEYVMNCLLKLKSVLFREVVTEDASKHLSGHFVNNLGDQCPDHLSKFFAEDTFFVHEQNNNLSTCNFKGCAFYSPSGRTRNWTPKGDTTE